MKRHTGVKVRQEKEHHFFLFFKFSPEDMFPDFREREREKKRERNTDQLPPVHAPTIEDLMET